LIGLLGTVIGMIRAFNAIAFQTAVVKPILLAGGVSQAMVTTAAGLIVAIPAMIFYAYFRGRVHDITNIVENYSTDIIKIVEAKASSKK
jgi:biopolymer transport protein ExbB